MSYRKTWRISVTEKEKQPIYSMTGYANASCEWAAPAKMATTPINNQRDSRTVNISVELRTVNSRFLEFHFRLPEELAACEPVLREIFTAKLARGKVEVRIHLQHSELLNTTGLLNDTTLAQLAALQTQILDKMPAALPLRVSEIL